MGLATRASPENSSLAEAVRSVCVCVTRFNILKNMFISNSLQLELPLALGAVSEIEGV